MTDMIHCCQSRGLQSLPSSLTQRVRDLELLLKEMEEEKDQETSTLDEYRLSSIKPKGGLIKMR